MVATNLCNLFNHINLIKSISLPFEILFFANLLCKYIFFSVAEIEAQRKRH